MASENGVPSNDLFHAQARIWNHMFNFINSMSLKCAVQLQIPDIINHHGAPMLLPELVEALSINKERTPFVYRLMRILVHSGFFVKQRISTTGRDDHEKEREGYLLAPASRFLLKEDPLSMRSFLLAMLDPILMDPWQHMSKWFQNDDSTPFHTTHGKEFWDLASKDPKLNHFFNESMASDSRFASIILEQCSESFHGLNSIVDVGGGTGTVAKTIAKKFPKLNCISFDLPHVVSGLEVCNNNLSYVGGDMFEAIPKADAILLKWILHDWNDEECVKILKRCKEAIPIKENGGKLIIIEMVMKDHEEGDDKSVETQFLFDMLMMALLTGKERSEKEWAKLLLEGGFVIHKIAPTLGLRSVIEAYPTLDN